jgi:hypothetical protein
MLYHTLDAIITCKHIFMLLIQAILIKLLLKPYALYDLKFFSIIRLIS